jgi:hypothetical protein
LKKIRKNIFSKKKKKKRKNPWSQGGGRATPIGPMGWPSHPQYLLGVAETTTKGGFGRPLGSMTLVPKGVLRFFFFEQKI